MEVLGLHWIQARTLIAGLLNPHPRTLRKVAKRLNWTPEELGEIVLSMNETDQDLQRQPDRRGAGEVQAGEPVVGQRDDSAAEDLETDARGVGEARRSARSGNASEDGAVLPVDRVRSGSDDDVARSTEGDVAEEAEEEVPQ